MWGGIPRASNTWPDLSVPSGSVKETISLYLGNLTCDDQHCNAPQVDRTGLHHTLSRMTSGPFTPPMVL